MKKVFKFVVDSLINFIISTITLQHEMKIGQEIKQFLHQKQIDFVRFVDVSMFAAEQNRGYKNAIVFGKQLSAEYINRVACSDNYVEQLKQSKNFDQDEFHCSEKYTDEIADVLSEWIEKKGYQATSQSEKNLIETGGYDGEKQRTLLPHKTVATMAGIGWIGKNNLLVSPDYGCAISMCTVLTNVDLETIEVDHIKPNCGACSLCMEACESEALSGVFWTEEIDRDELLKFSQCTSCLKCMVRCPWNREQTSVKS